MDPSDITVRETLQRHLADNGFPADGGVSDRWGVARVGPIPVCIPNIKARRNTIPIHDLNHVLSGYGHDAIGEAEIGAFELGGGCQGYWVAWLLDWGALLLGITRPKRLFAAFVRGRRTGNLYGKDLGALLDRSFAHVRAELGFDDNHEGHIGDLVRFGAFLLLSPLVATFAATPSILTSPLWLAERAHRQRRVSMPADTPTPSHRRIRRRVRRSGDDDTGPFHSTRV
jgi:hypothetical protein